MGGAQNTPTPPDVQSQQSGPIQANYEVDNYFHVKFTQHENK